jgi:hypothetical protein
LGIPGGYKPGSDVSRQLIAFSNVYWAKRIGAAASGSPLGGKPVCVLTSEQVSFDQIKSRGSISRVGAISSQKARAEGRNGEVVVCINPGGEETWERTAAAHGSPRAPFIMLNNAYSTSYGLGNTRDFEEAYFLKRISKGWVFRAFPGSWQAYLEKPDGTVELLESYKTKPQLKDVATLVREESFKVRTVRNAVLGLSEVLSNYVCSNSTMSFLSLMTSFAAIRDQQRQMDSWLWRTLVNSIHYVLSTKTISSCPGVAKARLSGVPTNCSAHCKRSGLSYCLTINGRRTISWDTAL